MGKIKKVVITAAGIGSRVLPWSKSVSKEMLPVIVNTDQGHFIKPFVQFVFEKLYENGIDEFCFVIGRNKSELINHFSPDWGLVDLLEESGKTTIAQELKKFYEMIEKSKIFWIPNPNSRGFGHSVLKAEPFVGKDPFIVCASDVWVTSNDFLKKAEEMFFSNGASATLILKKVQNWWDYGVAVVKNSRVTSVIEKPKNFISDLGIVPIYLFNPKIFDALKEVEKSLDKNEEFHLTFAIQKLVENRYVNCLILKKGEEWLDTGMPAMYKKIIDHLFRGFP